MTQPVLFIKSGSDICIVRDYKKASLEDLTTDCESWKISIVNDVIEIQKFEIQIKTSHIREL